MGNFRESNFFMDEEIMEREPFYSKNPIEEFHAEHINKKIDEMIIKSIVREFSLYKKIKVLSNPNMKYREGIEDLEIDLRISTMVKELNHLDIYQKTLILDDLLTGLDEAYARYMVYKK